MVDDVPYRPMQIRLSDERRERLIDVMRKFWMEELDEELSEFRARRILEILIREIGAPVYNQAVQDARKLMLERLAEIEGDLLEPESDL